MFQLRGNTLLPAIPPKFRKSDIHSVFLFVNARDEPAIAEWVMHHLLLEFDRIYIFDHLSKIPIRQQLSGFLAQEKRIIVQRIDGVGNIKTRLMQQALEICREKNVSWMLYLDADEFLLLNRHNNVKSFLREYSYADAIGINWLMFGSSNHVSQPQGLITENFVMSEPRVDMHVKSFVRPEQAIRVKDPHSYIIQNPRRYISASTNLPMRMGPFCPVSRVFTQVSAYVAHYIIQSEKEFLRRKGRSLDDGSANKTGLYPDIHKAHNIVPNNQLQNKYSKRIRKRLEIMG